MCFVGPFPAGIGRRRLFAKSKLWIPSVSPPTQEVVRTLGGTRGECIGRVGSARADEGRYWGEGGVHAASHPGCTDAQGGVLAECRTPRAMCSLHGGQKVGGRELLQNAPQKTLDRKGGGRLAEYNQHISNNLFDCFERFNLIVSLRESADLFSGSISLLLLSHSSCLS